MSTNEPTNESGLTFEAWYRKTNAECAAIAGVGIDDLGDGFSYDAWANDATPKDYAVMMLEEAGYPFEPAPAPAPEPANVAPNGQWYYDTIVTESGTVYSVNRTHAHNGRIVVLGITSPPEGRNR